MGNPLAAGLNAAPATGVSIVPLHGIPEVRPGDDVAQLAIAALDEAGLVLQDGDILVVASKIVSKAAGRQVTTMPRPGSRAEELAAATGFEPGFVELILSESSEVLRARPRVLVVETRHGLVCANAGIDRSNAGATGTALLLPRDSDASAHELLGRIGDHFHAAIAVLVSDTFGRPFRHGLVNVAIGVAGMKPIRDYRGDTDPDGHVLEGTELGIADELCSAAELVMNKLDRVPVAVIRGYRWEPDHGSIRPLLRDPAQDYFR